jgi:iron complex outermembrane receptor protein
MWENFPMVKTLRPAVPVVAFALFASNAMGQATQEPPRVTLPPVEVTAQKEPEDPQVLPLSVTVMLREWLTQDDSRTPSEAGWFSPNIFFSEFSARKLSNARFRGVGSSPANPGITSYIDGVAQLNASSSSIEFLDIDQVEFVRGPQSALFGRNARGGVITVMSRKPCQGSWESPARPGHMACGLA